MVNDIKLQELKLIIKEEYGRELSDSELYELGNGLVRYLKALKRLELSKLTKNNDKK